MKAQYKIKGEEVEGGFGYYYTNEELEVIIKSRGEY